MKAAKKKLKSSTTLADIEKYKALIEKWSNPKKSLYKNISKIVATSCNPNERISFKGYLGNNIADEKKFYKLFTLNNK